MSEGMSALEIAGVLRDMRAPLSVAAAGCIESLVMALQKIAAIENKDFGPDWEEIEEAREIARAALSLAPPVESKSEVVG